MNQQNTNIEIPNIVLFKRRYKEIVRVLVCARKESGITKESLAEWLDVDRRKVFAFENLKKVNIELLLLYADKFSIDVKLKFEIN